MAGRTSLEDLLKDIPHEKLNQPCRDDHLSEIALSITDWQSIAPFLGLTEADEVIIRHDYPESMTRKIGMLRTWKKRFGSKATYRKLAKVFFKLKRADLVEEVCELLQTESSSSSSSEEDGPAAKRSRRGTKHFRCETKLSARDKVVGSVVTMDGTSSQATQPKQRNCETQKNVRKKPFGKRKSVLYPHTSGPHAAKRSQKGTLDSYAEYLRGRYSTEPPKFFTPQWPPPPTDKVFNLAMIKQQTIQRGPVDDELVRLTLRGNVDDIMERKTEVKLENIFNLNKKKRKVILIEGAPGAGKSTLAWHICQTWESGELFQEFRVVIFVQLRDPAIQSAKSLADILPVESENMRSEVMSEIQSCRGCNVLFVLDGWDEYGPGLQVHSLFWSLICRPGEVNMHFSSLIITSRPIASGELQQYASSRVEIVGFTSAEVKNYFGESIGDTKTERKLQDHLRERPVIEASCYLPLNAAIIVHLFLALNHTLPHTFQEMFLSLILCCIIRHLTKEGGRPHISSLDDLPPDVQEPFKNICTMAYHGMMKNKVTFSAADLLSFNLPTELSTLSLIQGVQSFTAFDTSVSFNFLHLSVQELLAAFHISKLPDAKQILIFNDLFDQPRLAAVFRFYAAFTKLQTEGVRDIVARIAQKQKKPLLVNLLHGLYEAQDSLLCQFVASHLNLELNLRYSTLSPMDCLVVGYFLSCVCLTTSGQFKVNLPNCSLDDYRIGFLIRELSKCSSSTDARTTTGDEVPGRLAMDLRSNQLSGHGICSLLQVMNAITTMDLSGDNQTSGNQLGDSDIVLISDSLKTNTILKRISVARCGISEKGGKAIGDALMVNRSLQVLDLHANGISQEGGKAIGDALMVNRFLQVLHLHENGISQEGSKAIGDALMVNRSLQVLDLHDNPISTGVVHIAAESLKDNHSLQEIDLSRCGISEKGAESLAISLKESNSLQTLNLRWNNLSDGGATHIADGLRHNNCLKIWDISHCRLGDRGMKSIGSALEVNSSLEELDLSDNSAVTAVGLMALGGSLKRNRGLKKLSLLWCDISDNDWKQFIVCLQDNNHLTELQLPSSMQQEMTTLNDSRRKKNLPPLRLRYNH